MRKIWSHKRIRSGVVSLFNYILIIIFVICSAFFSASEISFASASEVRLKNKAENNNTLASKLAYKIYSNYESVLASVLIGNNLVNIASSSVATVIIIDLLGESNAWVATLAMTIILLIFGEILPKVAAKTIPDEAAAFFAIPLYGFTVITKPLVFVVDKILGLVSRLWKNQIDDSPAVTDDELESIIDTVEDEGVIDEEKCDLIQSVFDFEDVQAYEVITPRVDMLAIDVDSSRQEMLEIICSSSFSRIPVYRDTIDNIIGVLHVNRVLKELSADMNYNILSALMPATFVYKTMPLDDVLKQMQKQKNHMAIVTDEYGGVMGILTMEDVLEQLVGDIWDESDTIEPEIVQLDNGEYEVDGDMRIEDLFDELNFSDKDFDDDNATVGGFVVELLERYARKNDVAYYKNIMFTVLKTKKHRVTKIKVTILPAEDEETEN